MRILVLASHPFYQERGTPIRLRRMVEALADRGDEVLVLTFPEGEDVARPNLRTTRLAPLPGLRGIRPGFSLKKVAYDVVLFWQAVFLIRRSRWDVIHAVEDAAFLALVLKRLFGVPYIFDMHSSVSEQLQERFPVLRAVRGILDAAEGAAVRHSCGVIAVSAAVRKRARGFDAGTPAVTVEDAADLIVGEPPGATSLRDQVGGEGPLVLYVGNLEHYQGIDLLLESWPTVRARHAAAKLVLVGGLPEDVARYRERARDLCLANSTHFLGPRPVAQLGWYLQQADVLVSPRTKGQNTSMKLYAYLAAGRPLVATRLPTHTQVLSDDIAVLAEACPRAFGNGISDVLDDPEHAATLARRAATLAAREYSMSAFRRKLFTLYASATASRGS